MYVSRELSLHSSLQITNSQVIVPLLKSHRLYAQASGAIITFLKRNSAIVAIWIPCHLHLHSGIVALFLKIAVWTVYLVYATHDAYSVNVAVIFETSCRALTCYIVNNYYSGDKNFIYGELIFAFWIQDTIICICKFTFDITCT